jgi:hypothetical protein
MAGGTAEAVLGCGKGYGPGDGSFSIPRNPRRYL